MAVTIKDVAREAGVSISTVSKVVNNSHEISEPTAVMVREVMQRLDYTPNVRAASFKRRQSRHIAYLTVLRKGEAFVNPWLFEFLCGAHGALARKGYSIALVNVCGDEKPGDTLKSVISAGGHDGVIVHGEALTRDAATMLARSSFPHIIVGKPEFDSPVCWLDNDNILACGIAVQHLAEGGARHIAFIGGGREDSVSKKRLAGAYAMQNELGLIMEEDDVCYTDFSIEGSRAAAMKLLTRPDRPDGIICLNNIITIGVLRAVREMGLNMPTDLQVITFDEYPFSRIMDPQPTVVNIDVHDLGEQVASQLLKNIRNPALHVQSYITLPELIIGETTKATAAHKPHS